MKPLTKEFNISPLDRNSTYHPGDIIRFGAGRTLRVLEIAGNRIRVTEGPSERQETLGRLLGRPAEECIP